MKELKATVTERRRQTRNSIYKFLYNADRPPTKQDISQKLRLSLPTVHQNIAELLDADLIKTGQMQESTGGRRPVGYIINSRIRFAVGVSISTSHHTFLASDLKLNEIAYKRIKNAIFDSEETGKCLHEELEAFLNEKMLDRSCMLGVGITLPGVLDQVKDEVKLSPTLNIRNLSLGAIRKHLPYSAYIENDGSSGGFAEWFEMGLTEKKDFVYLHLENGVGGAVFINGQPYVGTNKRSGEFGHMCVEPEGLNCQCGKRGCLEAYTSASRLSTSLGISLEEFFERLKEGNSEYDALWEDVLKHLAIGINNLRMAFDCEVVLGGFMSQYLVDYLPILKEMVASLNTFEDDAQYVRISRYPLKAEMMGAAWHFIGDYIDSI